MKEYKNIDLKTKKIPLSGLGQWIITISGDDWAKILHNAKNNLVANLQIPGFRKGKVPANIAEKHIKEEEVLKTAGNNAIKIAYQYGLDQKDLDVRVTNKPGVEITDLTKNSCELVFNFDLPLEVKLGKYCDLNIKRPEVKVSKEEIDQQIKLLKDRFAIYQPKEQGTLAMGDIAVFDFKGTIDGEEFPGNQAKDAELEIGSKQFIADFEEQMVGMKPNESKVLKVTFPKDYHVPNLAGKEADFAVDLKTIKIKLVTDSEEELVKDVNIPNVDSYPKLISYIKEQLTQQKLKAVKDEFLNQVFTEMLKDSEVVVPNSLIDKEAERLINDFKTQLKQKNVSFEEYQKMTNISEADVKQEAQKDALWQLQTYILTEEVAKAQQISVSDTEVEEYLEQISVQFGMPIEEIKKNIQDLSFINTNIRRTKTLDWLWDNNGQQKKAPTSSKKKDVASKPKASAKKD